LNGRVIRSRALTGLDWHIGIPIGALTSRVVANVALASLDRLVERHARVLCYRRYVDDIVLVAREARSTPRDVVEIAKQYIPIQDSISDLVKLNNAELHRGRSDFRLQRKKLRVHLLNSSHGRDFIEAVASDFQRLVSESRAFLDGTVLNDDTIRHAIRAGKGEGSPLRVLRDADRAHLERLTLSTRLHALERVADLVDPSEALPRVRRTLGRLGRVLDGEENWVDNIDLVLRFLRLGVSARDWQSCAELIDRMDALWGDELALRRQVRTLYHQDRVVPSARAWSSLRNYLHERRLEAVCGSIPPRMTVPRDGRWPDQPLRYRSHPLSLSMLLRRARMLAASDLRFKDREDDRFLGNPRDSTDPKWFRDTLDEDTALAKRLDRIAAFVERCDGLHDSPWRISPARLFLAPRPPSYFDVARRWLFRTEVTGFSKDVFDELLQVVNAVRGTQYHDPVGDVLDDHTVVVPPEDDNLFDFAEPRQAPRLVLGGLVVTEQAWAAAARGRPILNFHRLLGLSHILERAENVARRRGLHGRRTPTLLLLPELSLPRTWFRSVANHIVRMGRLSLVTGLEYACESQAPIVHNQVYAVFPGPFRSVATWPWTKRLPARLEGQYLAALTPPRTFAPPTSRLRRTVVHTAFGKVSVLICSELIEVRRTADLLGRVELVLSPSWNVDTASYDHLIRSVGLQLHAIIAVVNNAHYSDCRAWAPHKERWQADLARLIQRDVDEIVYVDLPIADLQRFHRGMAGPDSWKPLPPDWH